MDVVPAIKGPEHYKQLKNDVSCYHFHHSYILNTFNVGLSIYPPCKNIRKIRLHVLNHFEIYAEIILK